MLHIPFNSATVIEVYKSQVYTLKASSPQTLTELYTSLCRTLLHGYMSKKNLRRRGVTKFADLPAEVHRKFTSICQKAFEMLDNQTLIFHQTPMMTLIILVV